MSQNLPIENPEEIQSITEPAEATQEIVEDVQPNIEEPAATVENPVEAPEEEPAEDQETFPRSYVEKLRKEAAGHRDRAKRADDFAQRLHTALVEATGRLADARDLPYEESHLDNPEALSEAIAELLADKPHLASRKPMGNIGQGLMSEAPATVSLGSLLRANAN